MAQYDAQLISSAVGFGTTKRQDSVFNREELSPNRNSEITGIAAQVCPWAVIHKAKLNPAALKLIEWLMTQIDHDDVVTGPHSPGHI